MRKLLFPILFLCVADMSAGEAVGWGDSIAKSIDALGKAGFKLRKSIDDKTGAGEPAAFSATRSRNDSGSTTADIALGFEKDVYTTNNVAHSFGPMIEYHRNDNGVAPSKETKSYGAGFTYQWLGTKPGETSLNAILGATLAYKNDRIKNGEGGTASFSGSLRRDDIFLSHVPITKQPGQLFPWGWFPGVALQAEHGDNLEAGKKAGEVYRAKGEFSAVARPFNGLPIQVMVGVIGWRNFHKTGPFERYHRDQKLFRWTVDFFLSPTVSIGLTHLDGANPETNYKGDRQTTFGLKAKI